MLPSEALAEMLPEVPSTNPFATICLAAARTAWWASSTLFISPIAFCSFQFAGFVGWGQLGLAQGSDHFWVSNVAGALACQEELQVVGHHLCAPRLGFGCRATDVGRQYDVVHLRKRVASGEGFALEVVKRRAPEPARLEGSHEGVHVVELGASRVDEQGARAHPAELFGPEEARRLLGHCSVQRHYVGGPHGCLQVLAGSLDVGVVGGNFHAEGLQAPAERLSHRTVAE